VIGARNEMRRLVDDVVRPQPGQRLLDFGCGNGRLVPFVPQVEYVGVDSNAGYIDAARAEYGSPSVQFICGDLLKLGSLDIEPIDVVVSIGVLHHLDDAVAEAALKSALAILRPGGRLITMDPCFEPSQHSIARVLMALDRGRFVRHPADYQRLVERAGGSVTQEIWHDIYRFPYTHCIQVGPATRS
jgi:SAM-dependent methyltransferase